MLHGIEGATTNVHSQNDRIKPSASSLNPVELWQRRVKAQEQALKEAEDALERAEGEIRLATEVRQRKEEMEEDLMKISRIADQAMLIESNTNLPICAKALLKMQEIPFRKTIVRKQKHPIMKRKRSVGCLTVEPVPAVTVIPATAVAMIARVHQARRLILKSWCQRRKEGKSPEGFKFRHKEAKEEAKIQRSEIPGVLQHKKRKRKRKKRRQKLKNRQQNIAGHADSAVQDESLTGDEIEHYKSPRADQRCQMTILQ